MATFCTAEDLVRQYGTEAKVAKLARPDGSSAVLVSDSDVSARLTRVITEQSNAIRARLIGKVDVDSVDSGSQLADDLRRWATIFVLEDLFTARGHFTEQSNPYYTKKRDAIAEINATARRDQRIGDPAMPNMGTATNTRDVSPVFGNAAESGTGSDSTLLDRFG